MHHAVGRLAARTLALALVLAMVVPASAAAFDFTAPPSAGPINATLPLLGSSLTVDVATDDDGHLTSVALDPTGDFTATVDRPHAVRFETADGSVKVTITSWGGHTTLAAKTKTLADLEGAGTWKADLFKTGDPTTVKYTIGHDGAGAPTIVVDDVAAPAAIVATVGTPTTKTSEHRASAKVGIDFAWNGFTKRLTIGVAHRHQGRQDVGEAGGHAERPQQAGGAAAPSPMSSARIPGAASCAMAPPSASPSRSSRTRAGGGKVTFDPDTFATGAEARAKELRKGKGFVAIFKEHARRGARLAEEVGRRHVEAGRRLVRRQVVQGHHDRQPDRQHARLGRRHEGQGRQVSTGASGAGAATASATDGAATTTATAERSNDRDGGVPLRTRTAASTDRALG